MTLRQVMCAFALLGSVMSPGCAKRVDLSLAEFEELRQLDSTLEILRVFPSKKLISDYPEEEDTRSVNIARAKVTIRGAQRPRERIIAVGTSGKIVKVAEIGTMPLLWVTYFTDCSDPECAYGFVLTERGKFSLVSVPKIEGYQAPTSYRGTRTKRNRLRLGKQRSLAELNEVYVVSRRRGKKLLPIDLQIRKDTYKPTRKTRQRAPGV